MDLPMNDCMKKFPATLEGLSAATQFLQSSLNDAGCSEKTKSSLMVAMDEIASNIVYYSGAKEFEVDVSFSDDSVRVVFSDSGTAFDPLGKDDPDVSLPAEHRDIGGLGLFMVKRMMDELHYVHDGDRNVLTIVKRRV